MIEEKLKSADEKELLYRALKGEKEAWGEIVSRYKDAVYGVNLSILNDQAEAEDATQETFIKAWDNLDKYDMDRNFSTWLFAIGSNTSKNIIRKRDRWSFIKKLPMMRGSSDPQKEIKKEERTENIRNAVFNLDPKYRAPIIMRFWGEQSYEDISDILDIPEGTVKTRLHRGKKELKSLCREEGVE